MPKWLSDSGARASQIAGRFFKRLATKVRFIGQFNSLRRDSKCDFVIMPSSQIADYVALGVIKGNDTFSLRIAYDGKARKYSLNGGHDVSIFANRFGQIC